MRALRPIAALCALAGGTACAGGPPSSAPPSRRVLTPSAAEPEAREATRLVLPGPDARGSAELAATVGTLAKRLLATLPASDSEDALLRRALIALAAGAPRDALDAIEGMRRAAHPADPTRAPVLQMGFELVARARIAQGQKSALAFSDAFAQAFREVYSRLDDLAALHASWFLFADVGRAEADLEDALARAQGRDALALAADAADEASELCARYARWTAFRDVVPLAPPLQAEDDARRYIIDEDVRIPMSDGATLSAIVARPRRLAGAQPAILFHTIYTTRAREQALVSAAHGYVGVVSFTRGRWKSSGPVVPYEHEASDTHDVIDWIAKQPWSDGRVGMYGGSYAGFTQWAATKHLPAALKTIVPAVAAIPGQGLPMENNVFLDVNYGWAFYVTDGPLDDDKVYFDSQRWNRLSSRWFESGRAYREIDAVDGTPNPLLHQWLAHPSFDAYWQAMVPYADDFARIDIPVLTITGYYDDGQISALRYLTEHVARRKGAEHYLLIGPWDHFGSQRRPSPVLRGYAIDDVARTDNTYVTFGWFDHVLRGGPMPEILADRVNWEVMGANEWRHAPSTEAMHDRQLTLYLDAHRLVASKPAAPSAIEQTVDLADRKTQTNAAYYPDPIVRSDFDDGHGVVFQSEPFDAPTSIDGLFSGVVRVKVDRKDFDLGVVLYEKTPAGKYVNLSYYLGRASYARDMTKRTLLVPGAVSAIPFERTRMVSRKLDAGSRLVVVLNVNKNDAAQVNCGTGKDVSDESAADCGVLHVKWLGDSYVRIPVGR